MRPGRSVLSNGLRVVSEAIPSVRSAAVGLWVARGSRDETPRENGLCHLIEHLSFKGTAGRSAREIATFLESLGGHLEAFTSKEETCYYARVLDEHLPQAVDILSDIATRARFRPEDLEKERRVILEEIKGVEDTPDDLVHEMFSLAVFDGHPLSYPILGSRQNCRRFRTAEVESFRCRQYRPGAMVLAAAGRVDHRRLVELAGKHLGHLAQVPAAAAGNVRPPGPPRLEARRKRTSQVHLCLGAAALPRSHPDRYALLVLNTIFGGGMSSRLFQRIREEEALAYAVYSYADFYRDTGLFGFYLGVAAGQAERAARTALAEFRRLAQEPPRGRELENAQAQLKGHLMLGLESTTSRMMRLAKMELSGEPYQDLGQTIARIDAVRPEDLRRVARKLTRPDGLAAAVLGPVAGLSLGRLRGMLAG
jgi:predicted Zn-dependent peptidase